MRNGRIAVGRCLSGAVGVIDGYFLDLEAHGSSELFCQGRYETRHTRELAQRRTPPIGANITPTMKNRGRTLLGVKIGLVKD